MYKRVAGFHLCAWVFFSGATLSAVSLPVYSVEKPALPVKAAIASAHPLATDAGHEILAAGGNAFDAAVAVAAALAVVEPYSSGIGGGGFFLLHRADNRYEMMIDAREKAPSAADRDMYLDTKGQVQERLSKDGPLAAGIPGLPAGLVHLAKNHGRLPLKKSLAPAIRYAIEGFKVTPRYRLMAEMQKEILLASPEAAAIFLQNKDVPEEGYLLKQSDLGNTLQALGNEGVDGFYKGDIARKLVDGVRASGGIWQLEDLAQYQVVERQPLYAEYRGMKITAAPPPSSGGVALIAILNVLQQFDLKQLKDITGVHLTIEAMRRAYRDRAIYLGDPDFVKVPVERLTHPLYAAGLAAGIRTDKATASAWLPGVGSSSMGMDTTHFSVLDTAGNRVAATLSVNFPFGSGFVPPGTGVLLNNEMDDFSVKPGTPNGYGLIGAEKANAIEPGKRMLSSMTPTFLETEDRLAILGTPGGSRIITMVLLSTLEFYKGGSAESMVALPRLHHQFSPDVVSYEPGALTRDEILELQLLGHQLKEIPRPYGNMQVVVWNKKLNRVSAASDPRAEGEARVK